ncbi:MAG: hypothetical protein M3547_00160 [Acidobacteriota bacterium]|nr:hypothetical protein [Acidobacteriota bacterium]
MSHKILYPRNSQYVEVTGLKDQSVTPNVYVNNAVLTGTMKDAAGANVIGFVSVAGAYQAGSNGDYRFSVDPLTFDPPAGSNYTVTLTGSASGKYFHVELPAKVVVRKTGTEA